MTDIGIPAGRAALGLRDDEPSPDWLDEELCSTSAAVARLGRWHLAGRPDPPAEDVPILGDDELAATVLRVVARLPPPVRYHLVHHALLLPVGRSCGGFCARLPAASADAAEQRSILVVAYNHAPPPAVPELSFEDTAAHEIAHAFLHVPIAKPAKPISATTRAKAAAASSHYLALTVSWNMTHVEASKREQDELQACKLASSWGYAQFAETAGENARRRFIARCAPYANPGPLAS